MFERGVRMPGKSNSSNQKGNVVSNNTKAGEQTAKAGASLNNASVIENDTADLKGTIGGKSKLDTAATNSETSGVSDSTGVDPGTTISNASEVDTAATKRVAMSTKASNAFKFVADKISTITSRLRSTGTQNVQTETERLTVTQTAGKALQDVSKMILKAISPVPFVKSKTQITVDNTLNELKSETRQVQMDIKTKDIPEIAAKRTEARLNTATANFRTAVQTLVKEGDLSLDENAIDLEVKEYKESVKDQGGGIVNKDFDSELTTKLFKMLRGNRRTIFSSSKIKRQSKLAMKNASKKSYDEIKQLKTKAFKSKDYQTTRKFLASYNESYAPKFTDDTGLKAEFESKQLSQHGHTSNRVASLEFLAEEITYLHLEDEEKIKLSTNTTDPPTLSTYKVAKKIADPDTGMVAYCLKSDNPDDLPIVTFRGTNYPNPHMAEPAVGVPPRQITGMQANLAKDGMGTDCFKEGAQGYKELKEFMTKMKDSGKKCLMTGHSLGGVLAQLATMDEKLEGMVESLTIFQAPGVDKTSFNNYYSRESGNKLDHTKIFNSKRRKDELSLFQFKNLLGFLVVPKHVGSTKASTLVNHLSLSYDTYEELSVSMDAKEGDNTQTSYLLKKGQQLFNIKREEQATAKKRLASAQ